MANKRIVIGNLKMSMSTSDVNAYLKDISKLENKQVVICPTSLYIPYFVKHGFYVGIQNVYKENNGAYTGEVSPSQAYTMGIRYALVGHSERRNYFKETNELINEKVKACLNNKLKVVLCIGESAEEKSMLRTNRVLKKQLMTCLDGIKDIKNIFIAYEPIWAIGTNVTPTNDEIRTVVSYIKQVVYDLTNEDVAVLYGGSVNDKNINTLNKIDNIAGFLVGGASTDYKKFKTIIEEVTK